MNPPTAALLGSCIGALLSVPDILMEISLLRHLGDRLELLSQHNAFVLLQNSIGLPKLFYFPHYAPCFAVTTLCEYDSVFCSICGVTVFDLSIHQSTWIQSSLPVCLGGLGILSVRTLLHLPFDNFCCIHFSCHASCSSPPPRFPAALQSESTVLVFFWAWQSSCSC